MTFPELARFYEDHLLDHVMPFWERFGIDRECAGVFNFLEDDGTVVSHDKVLWSQGRALWTFSALYNHLGGAKWLAIARGIAPLVMRYGRDGMWPFRVNRAGEVVEGPQSVSVDAFAIYGLTEYARAAGDARALELALAGFRRTSPMLADHSTLPTRPHPIPPGMQSHGPSMIFALVYHELGLLAGSAEILERALELAEIVMRQHLDPERRLLYEFVRPGGAKDESDAGQTVVPGHVIESMWFLERIYSHHGMADRVRLAMEAIRWHMELGWDEEYGGLLLAVHAKGGAPVWHQPDAKVWWPATEALYGLIRAYEVTGAPWCLHWYRRMHEYAFRVFPCEHGDWRQNLSRSGEPIPVVVRSLAVKDPFHLPRALLYSWLALRRLASSGAAAAPV